MNADEAAALKVLERYRRRNEEDDAPRTIEGLRRELQREGFPADDDTLLLLLRIDWSFKMMLSDLHRRAAGRGELG